MTADDAAAPTRLDADTLAAIRARAEAAMRPGWSLKTANAADAGHLSGLDPATTLALLDALDAAEADRDAALVKVATVKSIRDRMDTAERGLADLRDRIKALADEPPDLFDSDHDNALVGAWVGERLDAVLGDQETP